MARLNPGGSATAGVRARETLRGGRRAFTERLPEDVNL